MKHNLKVSRSQNKNCWAITSLKNNQKKMFFYPDDSDILETRISSFKYFRVIKIESQILSFVFLGEVIIIIIMARQFFFKTYWPLALPSNLQLVTPQAVTTSNNSHNSMGSPWRSLSKLRSNAHTEHRVTAPLSSCSMLRDHVTGGGGSACRGAASGGSSSVFGLTRPFSNGVGRQWAKLPKKNAKN